MIRTKARALLLLRVRAAHSDLVRAAKTRVTLRSRRLPAPLAFAGELNPRHARDGRYYAG